ncbi:MAG TPA: Ig-like domain-containing protein, partial [Actinomycetota bacterium]|nr:Ig-like domain-containing protein [Actinomycetota bacterium]
MTGSIRSFDRAGVAFATAVMIVLALVVPFAGSALASHPVGSSLEVLEEVDTNPAGTTHTLTAQLYQGTTSSPSTVATGQLPVNIDFEVEQGPAIRANCAPQGETCQGGEVQTSENTPNVPDMTCDIQPGSSSCRVVFTSDNSGTNIIRAFIDEGRNNGGAANSTYDLTEGRYAGPTDCGARSTSPSGTGAGQRCDYSSSSGANLTPQPGQTAEPDGTDVVEKTWGQAIAGNTCIDVDPNSDINPSGTDHQITATVTTAAMRTGSNDPSADNCNSTSNPGVPRAGVQVEFSLNDLATGIPGSDDPNAFFASVNGQTTNPSSGGPNSVTCTTDNFGRCTVVIRTVQPTAVGDNYVIGSVPGATGGTGGACANQSFPGTTGGTGSGAQNSCTAEVVRKEWVSPATVTSVDARPEEDTNEINTPHTITVRTGNALGETLSGQVITFDVTSGVNSTRDIDNNTSTPGGFIGQCTTGADGTCAVSYSSALVGDDVITACIDANTDFSCAGTEADSGNTTTGDSNDDQVTKHWVPAGAGASQVALDMEGCNGSTTNPADASWNETATPNDVSDDRNDAHAVCAAAFSSAGTTVRVPITFTITSGPGTFVVPSTTNDSSLEEGSSDDLGRSVTAEPGSCATGASGPGGASTNSGSTGTGSGSYNCAFLLSDTTGNTVVSACIEGTTTCDTGTKPWQTTVQNARNVIVTPKTAQNAPGTSHTFTATVTDRFGNRVPGVTITWSRTGEGVITSQETTTNAEGQARVVVRSDTQGTTTVAATIPAAQTDCDEASGAPAGREGSTAGNCTDSGTKTWGSGGTNQCSDGVDNDNDGLTDFPDDPDCSSEADNTESAETGFPEQEFGGATGQPVSSGACAGFTTGSVQQNPNGDGLIIVGTSEADALQGSESGDTICGLGGADTINGAGGGDTIYGNGGKDAINGGDGNDRLLGNIGKDVIIAGAGADRIEGGKHNDNIGGGDDNDVLLGQGGWDTLKGNAGNDTFVGAGGNDIIQAGGGDDIARGNAGDDVMKGFDGNDRLRGGRGSDILRGSGGRDLLWGGGGDDVLNGGGGRD